MEDPSVDLAFGRYYSYVQSVSQVAFVAVLLLVVRPDPAGLGLLISSFSFLTGLALFEFAKVFVAKKLSGHRGALSLPAVANPVRGDPSRGPLLRRVVLRFKKLLFRLKPYRTLAAGLLVLCGAWALFTYVTVCFGAPVFSAHVETGAFALLLTLLVVLPVVLVYGPDLAHLRKVFLEEGLVETDPLAHILFQNAVGAVVGAWFGAFPIPLDWDRAWQTWPIPCCVGAAAGSFVSSSWSLFVILGKKRLDDSRNFTKLKRKKN